ncbi:MAG: DUF2079 domain-containing protein [Synechococcus sp. MIT S9220]|uniref:DUF2079 domain-containing protein n=1 Tax=unclassified Synechococcus TaxID=2626047 RepID=UPI00164B02E9|nr:DUF2079 domain-containing protein [Synechococcus sp. MIT S9220]NOL48516.1 DUF2079 domain-containing protein [Synechococcus sp. MIT S9220]
MQNSDSYSVNYWKSIVWLASGFWALTFLLQIWRLESLSASYDQALFLQELWSTAQGRPFESSLSSVLSGPVQVGGALPWVNYLHLGQHANFLTLAVSPLVALLGALALPLVQVSTLTVAGLLLWRIASRRLPAELALRLTLAYFLSGAVIGPVLENFHDLIWLPLLGFLVVEGLLERRIWQVLISASLLLLVREDSGLLLFSLGFWALVRRSDVRWWGLGLMIASFAWVLLVTGWIQPSVDSSLADRFLTEKFGHLVDDPSGGTFSVLITILRRPFAVLLALVSPPFATLGFLLALSLPLFFVPLVSVDAALLVSGPLFVALVSQGQTALAINLRYVLALVPGLYLGSVLWWESHPQAWQRRRCRPLWTGALSLCLVLTVVGNPHRSLSAIIPDSFVPWAYVSPQTMLERREAAKKALAKVPKGVSVAADTPLLPLLAQREELIRFPQSVRFIDRKGLQKSVEYVVTFPGYYSPLAPVFKKEKEQQAKILDYVRILTTDFDYQLIHCHGGALVLRRGRSELQTNSSNPVNCDIL